MDLQFASWIFTRQTLGEKFQCQKNWDQARNHNQCLGTEGKNTATAFHFVIPQSGFVDNVEPLTHQGTQPPQLTRSSALDGSSLTENEARPNTERRDSRQGALWIQRCHSRGNLFPVQNWHLTYLHTGLIALNGSATEGTLNVCCWATLLSDAKSCRLAWPGFPCRFWWQWHIQHRQTGCREQQYVMKGSTAPVKASTGKTVWPLKGPPVLDITSHGLSTTYPWWYDPGWKLLWTATSDAWKTSSNFVLVMNNSSCNLHSVAPVFPSHGSSDGAQCSGEAWVSTFLWLGTTSQRVRRDTNLRFRLRAITLCSVEIGFTFVVIFTERNWNTILSTSWQEPSSCHNSSIERCERSCSSQFCTLSVLIPTFMSAAEPRNPGRSQCVHRLSLNTTPSSSFRNQDSAFFELLMHLYQTLPFSVSDSLQ